MGGLGTPPGALHRNFEENGASRTKDRYSGFHSLAIFYMVGSLGSWLIAKRTLIVLNHTRVLRAIFAALSERGPRGPTTPPDNSTPAAAGFLSRPGPGLG